MTHPLTWISHWLHGLATRRHATTAGTPVEQAKPQRLRKILVAVSRHQGAVHDDQLLVDELSPDSMLFYTRADLGEHDQLVLRLLIPAVGQVTLSGTVTWLRPSKGGLQGEVRLQASPDQRQLLVDFLARDAAGHR